MRQLATAADNVALEIRVCAPLRKWELLEDGVAAYDAGTGKPREFSVLYFEAMDDARFEAWRRQSCRVLGVAGFKKSRSTSVPEDQSWKPIQWTTYP